MRTYKTTQVFVAACAGLAFFGVAMLSLGPILGQLNAQVEGANSLPSTMSIGIILGTILFGPVVDRFGYKWLLIIGSLLSLAGLQVLAGAREIGLLHGAGARARAGVWVDVVLSQILQKGCNPASENRASFLMGGLIRYFQLYFPHFAISKLNEK